MPLSGRAIETRGLKLAPRSSMFGLSKTRVLLVGAGPAGLMSALPLEQHGTPVDIVDSSWRATQRDYAVVLHPGSIRVFEKLGVAQVLRGDTGLPTLEAFDQSKETRWERVAHESEFVADPSAAPWVRENLQRIPRCLPATGEQLISLADQLSLKLQ